MTFSPPPLALTATTRSLSLFFPFYTSLNILSLQLNLLIKKEEKR